LNDLKQPQRLNGLELRVPPLAVVVAVGALMWVAARAIPAMDFVLPGKLLWAVNLGVIGAVTCAAGIVSFRRARTTVNPLKPDRASSLVVHGIYKYTRNPMYLGLLVVLVAWATFLSNLAALVLVPVYVVYMNRFQIRPEERVLASLFPRDYPAYRAKVRRWL
jgi:protein-S-isoprenylcysteine O-methyltransferase Ste14